jgi:Domain of unknown function (DUF932)
MQKINLCLHVGADAVDREKIAAVHTPERTKSWVPISHDSLLNGFQKTLERAGMSVVNESHGLTKDGNRYFGLLQVVNGHQNEDFGLVIGLRNSHDKTFPAALAVGAAVFVCDNLSFSGEIQLARKHTVNLERDLPNMIERSLGQLGDLRRSQEQRFKAYKEREIGDGQAHDLIVQSLDAGVIPVTRIPQLLQEWRAPRHPEFRRGKTAWRLFNGYTETLKGNLGILPRRTQALHGLFDTYCGLAVSQN